MHLIYVKQPKKTRRIPIDRFAICVLVSCADTDCGVDPFGMHIFVLTREPVQDSTHVASSLHLNLNCILHIVHVIDEFRILV